MDAERGAKFTKLAREIIVAAKAGGGNPDANLRLRLAVQKARENSMPQDKIKNAIQRGTGEVEGVHYEEITYEGYGPAGVAILIECTTDNRNRTVADLRNILGKNGGRLGENGSVSWMFDPPKGLVAVSKDVTDEDSLLAVVLDAGAEDVRTEADTFEVYTSPADLGRVVEVLEAAGIKPLSSEITMIPNNTVRVEGKEAQQILRLMEMLEDHDDVQNVYANFDIPDEVLESAAH
jgi:YebC/PmpR family DNA-binding regulatory protein